MAQKQGARTAIGRTLNYTGSQIIYPLYRRIFEYRHGEGIYVMEKDWDNLILLDACRYDVFKHNSTLEGELTRVVSRGNASWQFIEENFAGKQYHDTIYVTANPFVHTKLSEDTFYAVKTVVDDWDEDTGTVLPEDVTRTAIETANEYPTKRLIVHYMQPHAPHLGEIAQNIDIQIAGWDKYMGQEQKAKINEGITIWRLFKRGVLTRDQLRKSYIQNLHTVEDKLADLLKQLSGKTVITSDHGENLGESYAGFTQLGHRKDTKECRFVPWLELEYDRRKEIVEEEPVGNQSPEGEYVNEKLRELGYLQ